MIKYKALVPIHYMGKFYYPADDAFSISQKDFAKYFEGRGLVESVESEDDNKEPIKKKPATGEKTTPKKRGPKPKLTEETIEAEETEETIEAEETEIIGDK